MSRELAPVTLGPLGGYRHLQRIDLVLIGARGKVGSAFRRQLGSRQSSLRTEANLDLRLIGAFDRRGLAFEAQGLVPDRVDWLISTRQRGDSERLLSYITRPGATPALVIDCTASDEIAELYLSLLTRGVGIVAANKRANAESLSSYQELQRAAHQHGVPYRYETTVGAAIPLLGPLRDLRLRGEEVLALEGVLSGSLSYILHRMHEGCAFSAAVAEAMSLGYTEPDPFEDLHATDLSRKLLVLAREAGFEFELKDLLIEPLIEASRPQSGDPILTLEPQDDLWKQRVLAARGRDERWVMLVEATKEKGRIGLRSVPATSVFAQLEPGQNLISIRTELQNRMPLCVSGPGAGVDITAAGVLSDVVTAAMQWSRQASSVAPS